MKHSILYLQYTSPANYPPLEQSGLLLLKAGWDVRYFGIESEGESNKLSFPEPLAKRQTLWKHQSPGIRQKLNFVAFTLTALWRALWQRPAWVYCSDIMSCPAAWLILKLTRYKVLYHEHDSPSEPNAESRKQKAEREKAEIRKVENRNQKIEIVKEQSDERKAEKGKVDILKAENRNPGTKNISTFNFQLLTFRKFLLWFRKRVGREADLVVLPNQKRLELFVQATGRRQKASLCVFNCPRKEEVGAAQSAERRAQSGNGVLRLAFHGSINRDRLPLAVLQAMSRFPGRVHLSVVGYETVGIKGYMTEFLQVAESLGLGNAVEFVGALPRHEIFVQASKCDVGLAFVPLQGGDVNMANMTGASNKPFDYLACGLALLVSARPDWEAMFARPGYGLSCNPNDAGSIETQLRWFLEHPVETREMGNRGRERILQEWNYKNQFAGVRTIMES